MTPKLLSPEELDEALSSLYLSPPAHTKAIRNHIDALTAQKEAVAELLSEHHEVDKLNLCSECTAALRGSVCNVCADSPSNAMYAGKIKELTSRVGELEATLRKAREALDWDENVGDALRAIDALLATPAPSSTGGEAADANERFRRAWRASTETDPDKRFREAWRVSGLKMPPCPPDCEGCAYEREEAEDADPPPSPSDAGEGPARGPDDLHDPACMFIVSGAAERCDCPPPARGVQEAGTSCEACGDTGQDAVLDHCAACGRRPDPAAKVDERLKKIMDRWSLALARMAEGPPAAPDAGEAEGRTNTNTGETK